MNQRVWEVWFIASLILFSGLFFIGTIEGSMNFFPNFLWYFIPSILNFAVCIYYGFKTSKE